MPVIDFHTHAFPEALAPAAVSALEEQGGIPSYYDGTIGGLLGIMDEAGIDKSVVLPVATKPTQVCSVNDWVATIASDRIVPFGAMHPDFPEPAEEVARMASLGFRGFKMHPEYQAFAPHEPRMEAIYAAASEHRLIALFHAGGDLVSPVIRGTAESFADVLDRWPDLTLVLAHLGGFRQWEDVEERLAGREIWLDTAYTLGHLPDEEFIALVRAHGADRVLFGSDGPWTDPAREIAHLGRIGFTDDELAGILGGNAERLLAR